MKRRVAAAVVAAMAGAPVDVYAKPPKPAHHAQTHQDGSLRARARVRGTEPVGPRTAPVGPAVQRHGLSKAVAARKACQPYREHIRAAEQDKKLPAHTLEALIWSESRCDPKAEHKRTRARGLGQFVPSGAAAVGRIQRARGDAAPWFTYAQAFQAVPSIKAAADYLEHALLRCGSLLAAVGMYGSGRCAGAHTFARGVLRLAAELRALTGEEPRT